MKITQLFNTYGLPVLGVLVVAFSYQAYGWGGVTITLGALVMWGLLHFTRMMQVLKRASARPVGHVDSAVMLNAKLGVGMTLLHVTAMTRSLGDLQSIQGQQPEIFYWTDASASRVTAEFSGGKLVAWTLFRPEPAPDALPESTPEPTRLPTPEAPPATSLSGPAATP